MAQARAEQGADIGSWLLHMWFDAHSDPAKGVAQGLADDQVHELTVKMLFSVALTAAWCRRPGEPSHVIGQGARLRGSPDSLREGPSPLSARAPGGAQCSTFAFPPADRPVRGPYRPLSRQGSHNLGQPGCFAHRSQTCGGGCERGLPWHNLPWPSGCSKARWRPQPEAERIPSPGRALHSGNQLEKDPGSTGSPREAWGQQEEGGRGHPEARQGSTSQAVGKEARRPAPGTRAVQDSLPAVSHRPSPAQAAAGPQGASQPEPHSGAAHPGLRASPQPFRASISFSVK